MRTQADLDAGELRQARSLLDRARAMLAFSYMPYSHFSVGAALLCADGRVYSGCNIENAAFGPGICAERCAIHKAVSEGAGDFLAIAIVGGHERREEGFCAPCGVCRQVMREFCDPESFWVILEDGAGGELRLYTLQELLPLSFGPEYLA